MNQITSDFGRRHCTWKSTRNRWSPSPWHMGIDFNAAAGTADLGYGLAATISGVIAKIAFEGSYKVLVISGGGESYGYGHIFDDDLVSDEYSAGDFILKQLEKSDEYGILNTATDKAYAELPGQTLKYNGEDYTTFSVISAGELIAPMGGSGGFIDINNAHLHLYYYEDGYNTDVQDVDNCKNPLTAIEYVHPEYEVSIDNVNNLTQENETTFFSGNDRGSIRVKVEMSNTNLNLNSFTYPNVAMDVNEVGLLIKKSFETDIAYTPIVGPVVESRINYGGSIGENRYPHGNNLDPSWWNASGTQIDGSNTRFGIDPHAYSDQDYDLFYFSDTYTRIHKDHNMGQTVRFADINDDARYPDGNYDLIAYSERINGNRDFSIDRVNDPITIKIDNFKPYVSNIQLSNGGVLLYTRQWQSSGANLLRTETPLCPLNIYLPVNINLTFSEPMQTVNVNIDGHVATNEHSTNQTYWEFSIPSGTIALSANHSVTISGTDMNGNQVYCMPDINSVAKNSLPVRGNSGFTNNTYNDNEIVTLYGCGADKSLTASCSCDASGDDDAIPIPRFSVTSYSGEHNNIVTFTNNSVNCDYYNWDFGDGSSYSGDETTITHTYPESSWTEEYTIRLTGFNEDGLSRVDDQDITIYAPDDPNRGALTGSWYYNEVNSRHHFRYYLNGYDASLYNFEYYMDFDHGTRAANPIDDEFFHKYPVDLYIEETYHPRLEIIVYNKNGDYINTLYWDYLPITIDATTPTDLGIDFEIVMTESQTSNTEGVAIVGEPFQVKAIVHNGQGKHRYGWYTCDAVSSDNCSYVINSESSECYSKTITINEPGTYDIEVHVIDDFNNQGTESYSVTVAENGGCATYGIEVMGCDDLKTYNAGEEITFHLKGPANSNCKGEGPASIIWSYQRQGGLFEQDFCTTCSMEGHDSELAWYVSKSFPPGEYIIKASIHESDTYHYYEDYKRIRNDFDLSNYSSIATTRIKVLDQTDVLNINNYVDLLKAGDNHSSGIVNYCNTEGSSVIIFGSDPIICSAVSSINYKPGFHATKGSNYHGKITNRCDAIDPPTYQANGDCKRYTHYIVPYKNFKITNSHERDGCGHGSVTVGYSVIEYGGPYEASVQVYCAQSKNCDDLDNTDNDNWNDICDSRCHVLDFNYEALWTGSTNSNSVTWEYGKDGYPKIEIDKSIYAQVSLWGDNRNVEESEVFEMGGCINEKSGKIILGDTLNIKTLTVSSNEILIYPNPTNANFNIEFNGKVEHISSIDIYNLTGQHIQTITQGITPITEINTDTWQNGMYIIRITTNQGYVVKKLVKE